MDKSCPAVETKISCDKITGKQRQVVESAQFLDGSTVCWGSETNLQFQTEEL
jgi:hypothetical protein